MTFTELLPLMEARPRTVSGFFIAPQTHSDARSDLRPLLDAPAVPRPRTADLLATREYPLLTMLRLRKLRPRTLAVARASLRS